MSQIYTDPKRESDPHALPNAEVFRVRAGLGDQCPLGIDHDDADCVHQHGWYWQHAPDRRGAGVPIGPFPTEAEAIADAQDGCDDE